MHLVAVAHRTTTANVRLAASTFNVSGLGLPPVSHRIHVRLALSHLKLPLIQPMQAVAHVFHIPGQCEEAARPRQTQAALFAGLREMPQDPD